jgi:hypothetical protein
MLYLYGNLLLLVGSSIVLCLLVLWFLISMGLKPLDAELALIAGVILAGVSIQFTTHYVGRLK